MNSDFLERLLIKYDSDGVSVMIVKILLLMNYEKGYITV